MTFAEWVQDYYEVVMGNGPVIYCDDWTAEPTQIWHSYVVYPYTEEMQIYVAFKDWFAQPMED